MHTPRIAVRQPLSRRAFLKGLGVTLSLPWLEAMTPGLVRAAGPAPPRRLVIFGAGLGFHGPYFFPEQAGAAYAPSPYLEVLREFQDRMTVFSGLSHPEQNGINGHASTLTWLTAARRPGLPGFANSISIDQLIASRLGRETREPYLTLATSGGSLSWNARGVEIPAETSPSRLFKRLFLAGTPAEAETQVRALKTGRSILDTVGGEANKLRSELGRGDQRKLDQYLESVRSLETRLLENEEWIHKPKPVVDTPPPTDIQNKQDAIGRTRLMNDMIALALQTDSTRTIVFHLNGMNAVPVVDGVTQDWHNLSHHGRDEAKIAELKLVEMAQFQAFRDFLRALDGIQEDGRPLLDRTAVLYGSNLGNASSHDWHNLPILVAGGGFRHGQHLAFDPKNNQPLSNLFVALARHMGVELDRFGTSDKPALPGFEAAT